jgi:heme exporter protein D
MIVWRAVKATCMIVVTLAALSVLNEARLLLHDCRKSLRESDYVLGNVNAAAGQINQAAGKLNAAADSQAAYWQKTSLEMYKTSASLRLLLVRTDRSLNDQIAPQLTATLRGTEQLSQQATLDLQRTTDALSPSLSNLARTSAAAADAMSDPTIKDSLHHLDETTASMAGVSADAKLISDKLTADFMKPQKFLWALVKELAGLGGSFAQMIK